MSGKVEITAKYGERKIKALAKMKGDRYVRVGILRGTGDHPNAPGVPIALIAWWNEFGTYKDGRKRVPARPFLRTTLREHGYYREHLKRGLQASLIRTARFMPPGLDLELGKVGQEAVRDIQAKIIDGPWVPNAARTIAKKSTTSGVKDRPLIESGKMRQSINWTLTDA